MPEHDLGFLRALVAAGPLPDLSVAASRPQVFSSNRILGPADGGSTLHAAHLRSGNPGSGGSAGSLARIRPGVALRPTDSTLAGAGLALSRRARLPARARVTVPRRSLGRARRSALGLSRAGASALSAGGVGGLGAFGPARARDPADRQRQDARRAVPDRGGKRAGAVPGPDTRLAGAVDRRAVSRLCGRDRLPRRWPTPDRTRHRRHVRERLPCDAADRQWFRALGDRRGASLRRQRPPPTSATKRSRCAQLRCAWA
jgi:hypothetical protein